jgi:hypothetical protein
LSFNQGTKVFEGRRGALGSKTSEKALEIMWACLYKVAQSVAEAANERATLDAIGVSLRKAKALQEGQMASLKSPIFLKTTFSTL